MADFVHEGTTTDTREAVESSVNEGENEQNSASEILAGDAESAKAVSSNGDAQEQGKNDESSNDVNVSNDDEDIGNDNDADDGDEDDEEEEEEDHEDDEDDDNEDDGPDVELGFFESDTESDDDEGDDDGSEAGALIQHEEGNWLRWDDGMAGGDGPVWLVEQAHENVSKDDVACPKCNSPMSFFLQVYAPLDGGDFKHAFHRTLYVFVCRKAECKAPAKVLRAQLPRVNDFYAENCGDEDAEVDLLFPRANLHQGGLELGPAFLQRRRIVTEPEPKKGATRCALCGRPATAKCVACKSVCYCSRDHQKKHWPQHKPTCKILREMPAHLRAEDGGSAAVGGQKDSGDATANSDDVYGRLGEDDAKLTQRNLAGIVAGKDETLRKKMQSYDKTFEAFQERVGRDPTQCIRYCRWPAPQTRKAPLWLSARDQCADVPACEACGAPRRFEFQILPQSLHFLRDLDMDFGTICIYTCTRSCALASPASLCAEFAFVQHPDAHCLVADA
ncbi:Programmed cell death protein 2 [Hondaea fermentalgiana]|uniref:Programmed cell death protein 2 n=1 Tax=Hondaea fermentalgiana TaxID=2315210 RepID=A0A2R5GED0_9STRA|nr:Programmed cell death protein 2 [Hondaea fermentalgiana]|eukprot:GBG28088.1 Programmed cell death protein 2 [Hondaea fermentalgiana]